MLGKRIILWLYLSDPKSDQVDRMMLLRGDVIDEVDEKCCIKLHYPWCDHLGRETIWVKTQLSRNLLWEYLDPPKGD